MSWFWGKLIIHIIIWLTLAMNSNASIHFVIFNLFCCIIMKNIISPEAISSGTIDWEKEAKETVRLDTSSLRERRRTIFELDSYSSSGLSADDILRLTSQDYVPDKRKEIRYSVSLVNPTSLSMRIKNEYSIYRFTSLLYRVLQA